MNTGKVVVSRRVVFPAALLALMAVLLVPAHLRADPIPATPASTAVVTASAAPFKVGVIVPLSGGVAEYGTAIVNGINLAREQQPEKLGACEFAIEDSAYKNTQAVGAFMKFQSSGIDLVYVFGGPMGEALSPLAESRKLPLIIDHIDGQAVAGRKFVVRYASSNRELGAALVRSLVKRGIKRAGMVVTDNQYLNSLERGFIESVQGKFEVEVVARVPPDEVDLRYLTPKLRAGKFDAVGLFLFAPQATSVAKNLHIQGVTLFSGDLIGSRSAMQEARGSLDGVIFPNNVVQEDFVQKYSQRFGNDAQIKFGAEGHDVAILLAEQLCSRARQGRLPPETVMQLLTSAPPQRGAQGETVFKTTPEGDRYFAAPVVSLIGSRSGFVVDE
jgi:branched-chain amino acid transport system substrate-binding protein